MMQSFDSKSKTIYDCVALPSVIITETMTINYCKSFIRFWKNKSTNTLHLLQLARRPSYVHPHTFRHYVYIELSLSLENDDDGWYDEIGVQILDFVQKYIEGAPRQKK